MSDKVFIIPKGTVIFHASYSYLVNPSHQIQWFTTSLNASKYYITYSIHKDAGRIYSYTVIEDIKLYDNSDRELTYKLIDDGVIPNIIRGRASVLDRCSTPITETVEYKTYPKHLEEYQKYILNHLRDYDGILDDVKDNIPSFVLFDTDKYKYNKIEYETLMFNIIRNLVHYEQYKDVPRDVRQRLQTFMLINSLRMNDYMEYLKDNIEFIKN